MFDFNKMATTYDSWYTTPDGREHDIAQKAAVFKLLPACEVGDHLLDVGCGTGHWSRFFARQGFEVLGVDIAESMIQAALGHSHPHCRFEVCDIRELPKTPPGYRVVAAMAVLEFIPDPEQTLAAMAKQLAYAGTMLVGTLNRLAPLNRGRIKAKKEPYAYARILSPEELRRLLEGYGHVEMVGADPQRPPHGARREHELDDSPFIVATVTPGGRAYPRARVRPAHEVVPRWRASVPASQNAQRTR